MRRWDEHAPALGPGQAYGGGVAVTSLRPGFDLVLCDLTAADTDPFEHEEASDLIGLGFHLRGGARFSLEDQTFTMRSGDCWIAATPRGARSVFDIGEAGFRTLSLRLSSLATAPVAWTVGGTYFRSDFDVELDNRSSFSPFLNGDRDATQDIASYAAFGETTFALGDPRLKGTLGLRYTGCGCLPCSRARRSSGPSMGLTWPRR